MEIGHRFKKAFGISSEYILEHRILNAVTIVGIVISLLSCSLNYFTDMPFVTVYGLFPIITGYVFIFLYSKISKKFLNFYCLLFGFILFIFAPVFWVINAGSSGTTPYFLILTLVLINITSKNNINLFFSALLFLIITLLLYFEYKYPEIIIGYSTNEDRLVDVFIGFCLVIVATIIALKIFMNLYRGALKLEIEQKKLLQEKQDEIKRENSKKAELLKDLLLAKESAEAANKSKSEFLANMSHEIRTPMNAILGFTEILISKEKDAERKNYLDIILSSGNALMTIINDILDLSRIEAGKFELQPSYIDLEKTLRDITRLFAPKANEKGLEFLVDMSSEIPKSIFLDEVRIRQVIMNLVGNAVKFTEKGYVKITINVVPQPDQIDKSDITIKIEDTGIGIPSDQIEKIFEPFEQVDGQSTRKYGGTGLGLSISTRLISIMGGEISAASINEKGSIFTINLPGILSKNDITDELQDDDTLEPEIEFDYASILIVDDVLVNRELVRIFLQDYNLNIAETENGEETLVRVKKEKFDLILLDWKMPGMSGEEIAKIIKEDPNTKDIPIIIFTASALKEEEERISKIADSYLAKPVNKHKLIHEIKRFLSHREMIIDVKKETESTAFETDDLPAPAERSKLIDILEKTHYKEWENVSKTRAMGSVKMFAINLQKTADEFGSVLLKRYANELLESANLFKVSKVKRTLNDFSSLINRIKL